MNYSTLLQHSGAISAAEQPQAVLEALLAAAVYASAASGSVLQRRAGRWQAYLHADASHPLVPDSIELALLVPPIASDQPFNCVSIDLQRPLLGFALGTSEQHQTVVVFSAAHSLTNDDIAVLQALVSTAITALQRLATQQRESIQHGDAEQRLRDQRSRMQALFDNASAGLLILDAAGYCRDINSFGADMFGFPAESYAKRRLVDMIDATATGTPNLAELLASQTTQPHRTEQCFTTASGACCWVDLSVTPFFNGDLLENTLVIAVDITQRKAREQRLRMLEAVILHMNDGVIVVDAAGSDRERPLLFANPAFCHMTGYGEDEITRATPDILKGPLTDTATIVQLVTATLRGERERVEMSCYRKDGSHFWAVVDVAPVNDSAGQPDYQVIVVRDVTRRKQAEDILRDREALLRSIGDNLPEGMIYQSALLPDGRYEYRYLSAGVERISGFTAEAVLADPHLLDNVVAVEDRDRVQQAKQEALRTLSMIDLEVRKQLANGEVRWSTIRSQPRQSVDGQIIFDGIEIDTTKRHASEQALRDSEEKYRLLFENSMDAILITNSDGSVLQANDAACNLLGHTRERLANTSAAEMLGISFEQLREYLLETYSQGYLIGELDIRQPSGAIRVTEYVLYQIAPQLHMTILRDITERKLAEVELRAAYDGLELRVQQRTAELVKANQALEAEIRERQHSEERYRALVETSPSAILVTDLQGIIRFCNQRAATLFGYNAVEALYGRSGSDLVDATTAHAASVRMILEPQQSRNIEYSMMRQNGQRFYAEANSSVVLSPEGQPESLIIVVHDVSKRKHAEDELTRAYHNVASLNRHLNDSRSLLQALFDGLEDGLLLLDQGGQVQVINRTLAALLDVAPATVIGQPWANVYQQAAPDFPGHLALQSATVGQQRSQQHRYHSQNGGTRILDFQVIALGTHEQVEQTILHVIDVTDTIRLQEQVIRAEHFAASGRLAASVAHEINTPLQTIQTNLKLLQRTLGPQHRPFMADALEEIHRVGRIVRQLLDFYRPAATKRGPIDLAALVERVILLLGTRIRDQRVVVEYQVASDLPLIQGRADELTQVMLNLVVNALDVMPQGGVLRLSLEPSPENQLTMTVADDGPGIPAALHGPIFDAFMTTKENGTGLGLSISKQIIEQHDGSIAVASSLGCGSSFIVRLPIGHNGK